MTQRFAPCWHKLNNLYFAHPRIAALLLGLMGATGFPPLELWPLTLLAVAGLIALLRQSQSAKQAALIGYIAVAIFIVYASRCVRPHDPATALPNRRFTDRKARRRQMWLVLGLNGRVRRGAGRQ